jgi:WbqC-like protein family
MSQAPKPHRKSIAIMQPVFLPWLGYFEQIGVTDTFMFLDDVQYTKQDWRNRNRIRTKTGWMWLTVPVRKASHGQRISETQINGDYWKRKHLNSLQQNYASAPYYADIMALIEPQILGPQTTLIGLTEGLIESMASYLSVGGDFLRASDVPKATQDRNERLIELCHHAGADCFFTGPAANDYLDHDLFARHGISVVFQDYQHPVYSQAFDGFESHMSVLDLLMNHGPASTKILFSSPRPAGLTGWEG